LVSLAGENMSVFCLDERSPRVDDYRVSSVIWIAYLSAATPSFSFSCTTFFGAAILMFSSFNFR